MPRSLTVFLPVDSDAAFTDIAADPQWWLPAPAAVPGGWVLPLHAGPVPHSVLCRVGPPVPSAAGVWRLISWEPSSATGRSRPVDRLLPRFTGELGVVATPGPTLVLAGSYEPPGAVVGSVADRAGLDRVADATARRFLGDVAKRLAVLHIGCVEAPLALG